MVTSEDFRRKFQTEPSEWKNSLTSLLSSHKAALETTQNKDQFIYIKCNSLQSDSKENRLMTTGQEKNLSYGVNTQRDDAIAVAIPSFTCSNACLQQCLLSSTFKQIDLRYDYKQQYSELNVMDRLQ